MLLLVLRRQMDALAFAVAAALLTLPGLAAQTSDEAWTAVAPSSDVVTIAAARKNVRQEQLPRDAITWYDTLGYPDVTLAPYVRVATGQWRQTGKEPRENQFREGFLLEEDGESFTVFLCNVSDLEEQYQIDWFWPLTTVRFIRRAGGPPHEQVTYELLDFSRVAEEVVRRVRDHASRADGWLNDGNSVPMPHRARLFAFGRTALQKGFVDIGAGLMTLAAGIPVAQTGRVEPERLLELLQQQIGDAVIAKAEADAGDPNVSWRELLEVFSTFDTRFPASTKMEYAREAASVLRAMIAEEARRRTRPPAEITPSEQVAEYIYQLRDLHPPFAMWPSGDRYPYAAWTHDGTPLRTPVHELVDLGTVAVPQLNEALDDRSFTRSTFPRFKGYELPRAMRVGDIAQRILEFLSGRSLRAFRTLLTRP